MLAVDSKALPWTAPHQLWCLCTTLVLLPLLWVLLEAIGLVLISRGTERRMTWCTPKSRIKSCAAPASLRVATVSIPMHTNPRCDFQCVLDGRLPMRYSTNRLSGSPNLSTRRSPAACHTRLLETTLHTVSPVLSSGLARTHADGRPQHPLLERPSQVICTAFTGSIRWQRRLKMSRTSSCLTRNYLGSKFRAAGFPGTSKSGVCWDPLQTPGIQDKRSESILRAVRSAAAERYHSFTIHGKGGNGVQVIRTIINPCNALDLRLVCTAILIPVLTRNQNCLGAWST